MTFGQEVFAVIETAGINVQVDQPSSIQATVLSGSSVEALVEPAGEIIVLITENEDITGVLDE